MIERGPGDPDLSRNPKAAWLDWAEDISRWNAKPCCICGEEWDGWATFDDDGAPLCRSCAETNEEP